MSIAIGSVVLLPSEGLGFVCANWRHHVMVELYDPPRLVWVEESAVDRGKSLDDEEGVAFG